MKHTEWLILKAFRPEPSGTLETVQPWNTVGLSQALLLLTKLILFGQFSVTSTRRNGRRELLISIDMPSSGLSHGGLVLRSLGSIQPMRKNSKRSSSLDSEGCPKK